MFGLPADFDPLAFADRTLDLICFSANTLNFHFDGDLSITLLTSYAHRVDGTTVEESDVPPAQSGLMRLVGRCVVRAEGDESGTLTLSFGEGHELLCFEDPHYESYYITLGEREIIV